MHQTFSPCLMKQKNMKAMKRLDKSSYLLLAIGFSVALTAILHTWTILSSYPFCQSMYTQSRNPQLPVRNKNGLIMVFIHIPKTGGTSIRSALVQASDQFLFGLGEDACRQSVDKTYRQLQSWTPGKFLLVELHTLTCPPYMAQRHHLETWRRIADSKNIPFFAFSMVREPFSNAVSWYSYYFGPIGFKHNLTESDFKESLVHNVQSLFLARSEEAYRKENLRAGYNRHEFETVSKHFIQDMDWIGTLEQQATETQPILNLVTDQELNFEHKNESPGGDSFGKANVTRPTMDWVLAENAWDIKLYQQVQARFTANMWESRRRFDFF
jgi:hypothetical protein